MGVIHIDEEVKDMIKSCEALYRKSHKEFDKINISYNKIVYEICRYYLK